MRLRYAIDTAIAYPSQANIDSAIAYVDRYPKAIRSTHMRHNLGQKRWDWLNDHGAYPAGSATEVAGMPAIKGTIEPEVIK